MLKISKSFIVLIAISLWTCHPSTEKKKTTSAMQPINDFFEQYYNEQLKMFPLQATANGDNRYNDLMPVDISDSYRDSLKHFYQKYLDGLNGYDTSSLS